MYVLTIQRIIYTIMGDNSKCIFFFRIMSLFRLKLFILHQAPHNRALAPACGALVLISHSVFYPFGELPIIFIVFNVHVSIGQIPHILFKYYMSTGTNSTQCQYVKLFPTFSSITSIFYYIGLVQGCKTRLSD